MKDIGLTGDGADALRLAHADLRVPCADVCWRRPARLIAKPLGRSDHIVQMETACERR